MLSTPSRRSATASKRGESPWSARAGRWAARGRWWDEDDRSRFFAAVGRMPRSLGDLAVPSSFDGRHAVTPFFECREHCTITRRIAFVSHSNVLAKLLPCGMCSSYRLRAQGGAAGHLLQ
mmetsp:Transcript_28710/g.73627  ORF Transcript_28710/g.73627 Transcript_28710/m.73627 type:complete len:120 (-) Transcript_28710:1095-1454(-)